jgi:hypothetical protein
MGDGLGATPCIEFNIAFVPDGSMTLSRAPNWKFFITDLRRQVERKGSVTRTVDEIIAATQASDPAIRMRWYWMAHRAGGGDYNGFVDAGLNLRFDPDERGRNVESVTFSLAAAAK